MDDKTHYKFTVAYDGTHYCGWQVQPNGLSIQAVIEKVLLKIMQEPIRITGSGRTDAGVHALGQTVHFASHTFIDPRKLQFSLNSLLPKDIRILELQEVEKTFHARYDATSKVYRYHLYLDKVLDPFRRSVTWHVPQGFDQLRLKAGIQYFLGTHDFTAFSNEAHRGVAAKDPIRTLYRIDIIQEAGGIALEFEGDGFLYKMVRNMVGMLVDVATCKREPEDVACVLQSKNRSLGSMAAPPQGLFLVHVYYKSSAER